MRLNDCWPWQGQKPHCNGFKRDWDWNISKGISPHIWSSICTKLFIVTLCVKIINIGNTINAYSQKLVEYTVVYLHKRVLSNHRKEWGRFLWTDNEMVCKKNSVAVKPWASRSRFLNPSLYQRNRPGLLREMADFKFGAW